MDLRAELLIFVDKSKKLFEFNVAYVRDGGDPNVGWRKVDIFDSVHDALECGRDWLKEAKMRGYKRGAVSIPRIRQAA